MLKLTDLISTYKPEKVLVLGDVKHTIARAATGEWHDVPEFFDQLRNHVNEIYIVRGNHDGNLEPLLPSTVRVFSSTGLVLDGVGFFHGHQWLSPTLLGCRTLVMGHVHPVVALRDPAGFRTIKQVWIRAGCKGALLAKALLQKIGIKVESGLEETLRERYQVQPRASELFIMPSFNDFLGGRPLNERRISGGVKGEKAFGPVLRSKAIDIENAEAYLLDGTFLGTISQLRNLS
jgi:metallophosphoesterase superfamily enzyme